MTESHGHTLDLKVWLCFWFLVITSIASAENPSSAAHIYQQNCAACHDTPGNSRIPRLSSLRQMSTESVLHALENGAMKPQAANLSARQKRAVAEYVSGKTFHASSNETAGKCSSSEEVVSGLGWNGWGASLANTRFQSQESSQIRAADVPKLKLRWAFAFPKQSMMAAQPAVIGNHLYIGGPDGTIYSLNTSTGCIYWTSHAEAGIRAAPSVVSAKDRTFVIFADLAANVYAFDASTGQQIWQKKVEEFRGARVSGSPQVYENTIYVPVSSVEENTSFDSKYECCRFRGSIVALDLNTGEQIWKTYTIPDPPAKTKINSKATQLWGPSGGGVWSPPTLDPEHNRLYVTTGNNYSEPATATSDAILALDMKTGKIIWSRQITAKDIYNGNCETKAKLNCSSAAGPDSDFGAPPILLRLPSGKRLLIASQKSSVVTAVDPDKQGEVVWQTKIGQGGPIGGIEWGASADADRIYAPLSDTTLIPIKNEDPDIDPDKGGGIFALDAGTGKIAWHTSAPPACQALHHCGPANSAPTTVIPGVVFAGAVDGHIRAYSTKDGHIIWDYNTAHAYRAVNGIVDAKGGSIDSAGPIVVGGKLFVVSGYPLWGGRSGNVLLMFAADQH
jgi:polyvinyl alcohol dehydrogenase (cytochrome)